MSCRKCGGENCGSSASSDGCDTNTNSQEKTKKSCKMDCRGWQWQTGNCDCGAQDD